MTKKKEYKKVIKYYYPNEIKYEGGDFIRISYNLVVKTIRIIFYPILKEFELEIKEK